MADSASAATMLQEVERVRGETRRELDLGWVSYLVFGALTTLSALFAALGENGWEGFYWLVAGPLGLAITWSYYRRQELRIGLFDRQEYALAGIVAAMVLGAIAVGWLASDSLSEAGWMLPIGAGLLALGAIWSSPLDGAVGGALVLAAAALIAIEPSEPGVWAALVAGAILLAGGVASRARAR